MLPAGPYAAQNNINRNGPFRQSQLGFIIIPAQQTYVVQLGETFVCTPPTTAASSSLGLTRVDSGMVAGMGDMWNSYTNAEGRNVKAWDYQVRTRLATCPDQLG